jgi:hypothetical protein
MILTPPPPECDVFIFHPKMENFDFWLYNKLQHQVTTLNGISFKLVYLIYLWELPWVYYPYLDWTKKTDCGRYCKYTGTYIIPVLVQTRRASNRNEAIKSKSWNWRAENVGIMWVKQDKQEEKVLFKWLSLCRLYKLAYDEILVISSSTHYLKSTWTSW